MPDNAGYIQGVSVNSAAPRDKSADLNSILAGGNVERNSYRCVTVNNRSISVETAFTDYGSVQADEQTAHSTEKSKEDSLANNHHLGVGMKSTNQTN